MAALDGEREPVQVRARQGARPDRRRREPAPLRRDDPRAALRVCTPSGASCYASDFDAYERLVRSRALLRLVQARRVPTWWPWLLDDPEASSEAWRERLRMSADLFDRSRRTASIRRTRSSFTPRARCAKRRPASASGADDLLRRRQPSPRAAPGRRARVRCSRRVPREAIPLARADRLDWLPARRRAPAGPSTARSSSSATRLHASRCQDGRVRIDAGDPATQAEVKTLVQLDLPHLAGSPA